jgi:hypothetical protein
MDKPFYTSTPNDEGEYDEWWLTDTPNAVIRKRLQQVVARGSLQAKPLGEERIENFTIAPYGKPKNVYLELMRKRQADDENAPR